MPDIPPLFGAGSRAEEQGWEVGWGPFEGPKALSPDGSPSHPILGSSGAMTSFWAPGLPASPGSGAQHVLLMLPSCWPTSLSPCCSELL